MSLPGSPGRWLCCLGACLASAWALPLLAAEPAASAAPPAAISAFPVKGSRVILMVSASFPEKGLTAAEREKLTADLRKVLEEKVVKAGLAVVDPLKNEAARKAAEEWAVMQEATPEKLAEAVRPFAIDGVLRVTIRLAVPISVSVPGEPGKTMWVVPRQSAIESIDVRGKGTKENWGIAAPPGQSRILVGKGETVEKACQNAVGQIVDQFAVSLRTKVSVPAVPVPADKKNQ